MSKAKKVVLIIAAVLVVGGIATSFGAFAAAGFDVRNLSNEARDWKQATHTFAPEAEGGHTHIVISDTSEDVRVEPTDGDAVEVTYWESEQEGKRYELGDEGGVIGIEGKNDRLIGHIGFMITGIADRTTVVKVPRSFTGSIEAQTESAGIDASQLEGLEGMRLSSENGHVKATQVEAGTVDLHTQNGMIEASGTTSRWLTAETQNGTATLSSIAADELEASSTNGSVRLSRISAQRVNADSMNGFIEAATLAADDIALTTTNGGIEALIDGLPDEYAISASSINGSTNAPVGSSAPDAAKHLTARSVNGHISVSFTEGARSNPRGEGNTSSTPSAPGAPAAPAAPEAPAAPTAPGAPTTP